jgi:hypothetical protein
MEKNPKIFMIQKKTPNCKGNVEPKKQKSEATPYLISKYSSQAIAIETVC